MLTLARVRLLVAMCAMTCLVSIKARLVQLELLLGGDDDALVILLAHGASVTRCSDIVGNIAINSE